MPAPSDKETVSHHSHRKQAGQVRGEENVMMPASGWCAWPRVSLTQPVPMLLLIGLVLEDSHQGSVYC